VVSALLGQLSAIRADNSEGAGYGAEAFAYAGSNKIFDEGSSEPLARFGQQVALSRSRGEAITSGSHDWRATRQINRPGPLDPCGFYLIITRPRRCGDRIRGHVAHLARAEGATLH
jgi:hypothetical protein